MNPTNLETQGRQIQRNLATRPSGQARPIYIRSCEDQQPQQETPQTKTPINWRKRRGYSFWHSDDFRSIAACVVVAIITAVIYFTMKG